MTNLKRQVKPSRTCATQIELACERCGNAYFAPPSFAGRKYCSWACRTAEPNRARMRERRSWSCEVCGVQKMRQPSEMYRRFCSTSCRTAFQLSDANPCRIPRVELKCKHCGSVYFKHRSQAARSSYCSRRCAAIGRPIGGKPSRIASDSIALWLSRHPILGVAEYRIEQFQVDLALPLFGVVLELDGCYWHSLPGIPEKDKRKDARLAEIGWDVRRITIETRDTATSVADRIEMALADLVRSAPVRRPRRRVARRPLQQSGAPASHL